MKAGQPQDNTLWKSAHNPRGLSSVLSARCGRLQRARDYTYLVALSDDAVFGPGNLFASHGLAASKNREGKALIACSQLAYYTKSLRG